MIGISISDVGKTAHDAGDFSEGIWSFPSHRKSSNCTRTRTTNAVHLWVLRDVVFLVQLRHQLVGNNSCVFVVKRVVFHSSVRESVAPTVFRRGFLLLRRPSRIDEDSQHYRDFPPINEIVEDVLGSNLTVFLLHCLPVLKHHQCRRNFGIVLGGNIDPIGVLGAGIGITLDDKGSLYFTLRYAILSH